MWDIPVEKVEWEKGHAIANGKKYDNLGKLSLKEIAAAAGNTGGPIAGHSELIADGAGVSFATHICDIEVDPETGSTRIVRYTVVQDAGKAVHCSDLPMIDTKILEIPNPNHPYGVRGVGETSIVPPLAAIGNALSNALGVRMAHVPMSPPRILSALEEGDAG